MKKILYLLPLALLALCTGCSQDDDTTDFEQPFNTTYWLTEGTGSIMGGSYSYDFGMITWSFNAEEHTVTIHNNNDDPMAYDGPDTGIYPYSIVDSELPSMCEKVLVIDGVDYGCFTVTENGLELNNTYADGYKFVLTKAVD